MTAHARQAGIDERRMAVPSRRAVLKASLGICSCAICATDPLVGRAKPACAAEPTSIKGPGYELHFIGAQRDTMVRGKTASIIDLRALAATPHLYAVGPIEQLRGEITVIDSQPSLARVGSNGAVQVAQSFETGAPFLVWAEVPAWRTVPIPPEVRSFRDLEAFVSRAAAAADLPAQGPFPFLVRGQQELIDFHILNRIGDEPYNPERQKQITVPFELGRTEATIVGFHSESHQGVFTAMDATIHIHFQTLDNRTSGHIQTLEIGSGAMLSLPQRT
jgi:acetolactate decarboxylase